MWQEQPYALWQCESCNHPDATSLLLVPTPVPTLICKNCKQPVIEFAVNPVTQKALFAPPGHIQQNANTVPEGNGAT